MRIQEANISEYTQSSARSSEPIIIQSATAPAADRNFDHDSISLTRGGLGWVSLRLGKGQAK